MTHPTENLSVLRIEHDQLWLWRAGTADPVAVDAATDLPENVVLAVPGEMVRLQALTVTPAEAKHLDKSLPFLLEEDVADDIDTLHFSHTPIGGDRHGVAMIARQAMTQLADALNDVESPSQWIPEPLCLPWQPGECVCVVEADRIVLRWGEVAGTAVSPDWVPLLCEAIGAEIETWVVYGDNVAALTAHLPEAARVDRRVGHFGNALMLATPSASPLNLRQGEYAPRLPLARWWQLWRPVGIAASVAVLLQLGTDLAHYQRLEAENTALRTAIQESYRRANPRGAVVDVEKQLDRQLSALRGGGAAGKPFTPLLTRVVREVAAAGDIDLSTLNYSASGDLRMTMTAPDFAAVEVLRNRLGSAGFSATLEGTSARGDRISARLVVAGS